MNATSIYLPCPVCGEEIEVLMDYERGGSDIGISPHWYADGFLAPCEHEFTAEQDETLGAEAETRANADGEFGITLSAWEEGPR